MKKVLILIPYYKPGFRSGGPQRTIENVCSVFRNKAQIYVVTQNYDFGLANDPYDVEVGKWHRIDGIKIMYLSQKLYNPMGLKPFFKQFDTIYSCGLFEKSSLSTLVLNKLYHKSGKNVYIAPMGVFSPGAFHSKHKKKNVFIQLVKILGLYKNIIWSFTSEGEYRDAIRVLGSKKYIQKHIIAEDLPSAVDFGKSFEYLKNRTSSDALNVIFLSRICPQKNLLFAINVLKEVCTDKRINFDIYGIAEDTAYWKECQEEIAQLPQNVIAEYKGAVKPDNVIDTFRKYDVFLFPTKGENYGHVIYESLAAGCIPIISDQTPWTIIEDNNIGRVISLCKSKDYSNSIEYYSRKNNDEILKCKKDSIVYAKKKFEFSIHQSGYKSIL